MAEQKAKLRIKKTCSHCVRFDSKEQMPLILSSVYLMNPAYEALGEPEDIEITVKKAGK